MKYKCILLGGVKSDVVAGQLAAGDAKVYFGIQILGPTDDGEGLKSKHSSM
jgi:hypothetical protein